MQALRILVHIRWHPHNREHYTYVVMMYYNLRPTGNYITTPQADLVYTTARRIYFNAKRKLLCR